jgi:C1A family cysteine protease
VIAPGTFNERVIEGTIDSDSGAQGHAVTAVGYDEAKQWFILRNSWGPKWGMRGHFTFPYAYLTDPSLAQDFWTIRSVE